MKTIKRYKFLNEGLKSNKGNHHWKIGEWYKIEGKLDICNNGFHCSKKMWQAFSYVQGELLAEVEVRGESIIRDDKECWSEMRIVKVWKWQKKDSVALSIYSAELCLKYFEKVFPDDKRPCEAIEAAKKWLLDPTEENESATRLAFWSAESAAWSAESAIRSAAWSAIRSAAWSAAWSAESAIRSAESAIRSAIRSAESAAWSAESAIRSAESAAWSAESAIRSASKKKIFTLICKWFDSHLNQLEIYE